MKKLLLIAMFLLNLMALIVSAAPAGPVPDSSTRVYLPSEVDHQPKLMVTHKVTYPIELKGKDLAGEVIVECVVDFDGNVRDPIVKASTRKEFEVPALQSVVKWKFRPGRKGKEDVNVRMELTVKFEPRKK